MARETAVQGVEETELKDRGWKHKGPKGADPEARPEDDAPEGSGPQPVKAGGEAGADPAAALKGELEQVRAERDKLLDRLARLQAEFENTRRREAKERADQRDYAIQSAVEPFLGVMDNFQLALKAQGSLEQLRGGVELILKQMETVGAIFDPRVHEALGSIETAEHPDHQVLEEVRRGYKIRDKLLRPALVRIASNTAVVSD
jgi:molecular chaperone GrpE